MDKNVLPIVLSDTISKLLQNNKLCSWNVHGGTKFTSVTIRFETELSSHVFPSTGYRRKSPCELRRDEQRAILNRQKKGEERGTQFESSLGRVDLQHIATSTPREHSTGARLTCVILTTSMTTTQRM